MSRFKKITYCNAREELEYFLRVCNGRKNERGHFEMTLANANDAFKTFVWWCTERLAEQVKLHSEIVNGDVEHPEGRMIIRTARHVFAEIEIKGGC